MQSIVGWIFLQCFLHTLKWAFEQAQPYLLSTWYDESPKMEAQKSKFSLFGEVLKPHLMKIGAVPLYSAHLHTVQIVSTITSNGNLICYVMRPDDDCIEQRLTIEPRFVLLAQRAGS